jgi:hypothetical protein
MPSKPWTAILFYMETRPTLTRDQPATYRIRLQGRISADLSDWLTESIVTFEQDQTVLTGQVCDQAALFGLLSFVRDLGVPLVSIEFIPSSKENQMNKKLLKTVFYGIAVAMGIAVIVLNIVNPLTLAGATTLLGLGVAALGIAGLQKAQP